MPQIFQTRLHTGYSNVCVLHGIISALHFQKKAKKKKVFETQKTPVGQSQTHYC